MSAKSNEIELGEEFMEFMRSLWLQPPEGFCKKGVLRNFAKFTGKPKIYRKTPVPESLL